LDPGLFCLLSKPLYLSFFLCLNSCFFGFLFGLDPGLFSDSLFFSLLLSQNTSFFFLCRPDSSFLFLLFGLDSGFFSLLSDSLCLGFFRCLKARFFFFLFGLDSDPFRLLSESLFFSLLYRQNFGHLFC